MKQTERVSVTPEAVAVIRQLKQEHGELMFHQSGGCCDGSQPMCFEKGEFIVGSNDVYLGDIEGCGFFMSSDQFEYWKHTQLTIDIVPGRGASFSLEIPLGLRFITRSRLFTDDELPNLKEVVTGEEYLELHNI
ncbi:hypothetical protein JN11_00573 [Mucilaginibacter frigoritolerans]|jgi:uncharacterized protein|uniref:DUF779 domain-containing protein n=1 Tax=Mucilaginibacter frigoritolerans TaxID=652788 RepID=A0A562UG85_9SPHI|nr:DUF779 domain-containing protein [Mucilaginibacter frigoritolerans]TWJ04850.1 hypothetical protein JN11_00573 [Mucilaginibacter frigoritolerans]